MYHPIRPQTLIADQDLFDHEIIWAIRRVPRKLLNVRGSCRQDMEARRLEVKEVLHRVEQTIWVVDAQASHLPCTEQSEHDGVHGPEDLGLFDANRRQLVDIEEASIVDLIRRHPPIAKTIRLMCQERLELVKAMRVATPAVHGRNGVFNGLAHRGAGLSQIPQAPLGNLFLPEAHAHPFRVGL